MSVAWAAVTACLSLVLFPAAGHAGKRPFSVGFVERSIPNVDPREAQAALEIWAADMVRQSVQEIEVDKIVSMATLTDTEAGIASRQFDLVVLPATYYLKLGKPASLEPIAVTARSDAPGERYCLLVRKDSAIAGLRDLKGKRLLVQSTISEENPCFLWVEWLLVRAGLPGIFSFFPSAQAEGKPSRLILPVFFRQADACVVSRQAFDTMVELNPQIKEQLQIIDQSPPMPEMLVCIQHQIEPWFSSFLKEYILNIHTHARGRQIMTLFQISRLLPYREEYLEPVRRLMQ
jgi:ABC-type phosphate/phosphonate transport system substrate-binding protein